MVKERWDESGHSRFRHGNEYSVANTEPFPQDRDGQIEVLATAFNNTVRAATLLFFPREKGAVIYKTQYKERFERVFGGSGIGEIHKKSAYEYPDQLFKRGLLDKVIFKTLNGNANHVGWALTDLGVKYQTIAAFFIQFEQSHSYSLYPILGAITVNRKDSVRAPMTRMKIMQELETGDRSIVQIAQNTKINALTVNRAIDALSKEDMVHYMAIVTRRHDNLPKYRVGELSALKKISAQFNSPRGDIARTCLSVIENSEVFTLDDILKLLTSKSKYFGHRYRNDVLFRNAISGFLNKLVELGGLARDESSLPLGDFSRASLTPKGLIFNRDFIHPLFEALIDDLSLTKMQNSVLHQVIESLGTIGYDIGERYAPFSSAVKRFGFLDEKIRTELASHGESGVSMKELQRLLKLSKNACQKHLKKMIEQGLVEIILQDGTRHYRFKSSKPADLPSD